MILQNKIWIGVISVCLAIFLFAVAYLAYKEDNSCNKIIFIEGELSRDVDQVSYSGLGNMIRIYYCDGTVEDVPTIKVIKLIHKDDVQ